MWTKSRVLFLHFNCTIFSRFTHEEWPVVGIGHRVCTCPQAAKWIAVFMPLTQLMSCYQMLISVVCRVCRWCFNNVADARQPQCSGTEKKMKNFVYTLVCFFLIKNISRVIHINSAHDRCLNHELVRELRDLFSAEERGNTFFTLIFCVRSWRCFLSTAAAAATIANEIHFRTYDRLSLHNSKHSKNCPPMHMMRTESCVKRRCRHIKHFLNQFSAAWYTEAQYT